IEKDGQVLPIEIKSGKDYVRHSALNNIMEAPEYHIDEGIVFTNGNVMVKGRITYLPIYMIMFLSPDDVEFVDISIERFQF
ncbi:MAG: AAA family ATPase, partial [Clostridiales bacterium]|nr:AAA family ATPase [Clostridiales bacterium]